MKQTRLPRPIPISALALTATLGAGPIPGHGLRAQEREGYLRRGTDNVEVLSHLPLGPALSVGDLDIEQELSRPFVYIARTAVGQVGERGMDVIDVGDPRHPKVIYRWRIENQELHQGRGGRDQKHFKWKGRYYHAISLQFGQGGPDADLGAVILDVTGLPDPKKVKEVARIREPELPGGFHNIFVYRHSDGRVYLFTTLRGPGANVYDLGSLVEGRPEAEWKVANVPVPPGPATGGGPGQAFYHDFYVGFHPASGQDRFYGGGAGGYYVYDVTDLREPKLLTSITGVAGVRWGHTFTPSPDGRYAVGETEYQYAPLRVYDLKPGLDGEVPTIRSSIGAWTANWRNLAHNHEVRWPYVFVSAYEDGLQVFGLMDPKNPVTVGYYDTYIGPHKVGLCGDRICNGAFGVDVRNADGLIVVGDMSSGFWAFRLEGFDGWNGHDWGMPNISSAQDWEHGPEDAAAGMEGGR
ncbi:MAG: LVIVD repeat-containing protein [Gemmatimonadota bacterium]